jgi:hypothetical protein
MAHSLGGWGEAVALGFMSLQFRYTPHQVPRGARPDAEMFNKIYLVKNVSFLRATYQIRLLAFKAVDTHKKLMLKVPRACKFDSSLKELIKMTGKIIQRENI